MLISMNSKHKQPHTQLLIEGILTLKTPEECAAFFDDLCTISELSAMAQRLEVAALLKQEMVYSDIVTRTGASSATISRVARCLNYGTGGYDTVLSRLTENSAEKERQ